VPALGNWLPSQMIDGLIAYVRQQIGAARVSASRPMKKIRLTLAVETATAEPVRQAPACDRDVLRSG
jgi:hypothetical protein